MLLKISTGAQWKIGSCGCWNMHAVEERRQIGHFTASSIKRVNLTTKFRDLALG